MKAIAAALLLLPALALGQATVAVPRLLPYQGRLLKTDGTPEAGSPRLTFCVYGAATGGGALWCEDQSVPLRNGFYAVFLGSVRPFEASLFDGNARWLGVAVDGATEMTPRQQIASVAYAITATNALQAAYASNASNAGEAQHAAEAGHAATATTATNAGHAASADTATNVPNAEYAAKAGTAASATLADHAKTADRASIADSAATADKCASVDDINTRLSALEQAGPLKGAFGYVSAGGDLDPTRSGPRGGIAVTVQRNWKGLYQIDGPGIGDGVLLVTREAVTDSGPDDLYVRVHRESSDRFTVNFVENNSDWVDTAWYFQIRVP